MLAGWLPDPRLRGGPSGLESTSVPMDHIAAELPAGGMSALWIGSGPLPPPLTDQQVSDETEEHALRTNFPAKLPGVK